MEAGREGIAGNGGASRIWKGESALIKSASYAAQFELQFYCFRFNLQLAVRPPT